MIAAPMFRNGSTARRGLLATLLVGALSSCAPEPPPIIQAAAGLNVQMSTGAPEGPPNRAEDICAIYRWMFPASVIRPLDSMFGDPRVSTRTEGANEAPGEVRAIRAAVIEATGGATSHWGQISEDMFFRAFQSWRSGPLPDCDWTGFARAVSAPARNGQIPPVLTAEESGSYTRVSRPFFVSRDEAIVLMREVIDGGRRVNRKLVFTYRDGDDWLMLPHIFEEQAAPAEMTVAG